ncbi:MAG: hypothetical protein WC586_09375 [Methanoregula sp.]
MNCRAVVGIAILLAVLFILPVSALSDVRELLPESRTGKVGVTLNDINGMGTPETVVVIYGEGKLIEIPADGVSEDQNSGIATVTLNGAIPAQRFTLLPIYSVDSRYAINSITVVSDEEPMPVNDKAFAVMPSTANYYTDEVPAGKQHEWVDLDWKDKTRDLDLTVYAPDSTLGPYTDVSDGKDDGRIFLDVSSRFNITPGHWFFKVQNKQGARVPYSLNTYSA